MSFEVFTPKGYRKLDFQFSKVTQMSHLNNQVVSCGDKQFFRFYGKKGWSVFRPVVSWGFGGFPVLAGPSFRSLRDVAQSLVD
jgi:hypothetical protein